MVDPLLVSFIRLEGRVIRLTGSVMDDCVCRSRDLSRLSAFTPHVCSLILLPHHPHQPQHLLPPYTLYTLHQSM